MQDSIGRNPDELVFRVPLWSVVDHLDGLYPVQGAQDMVKAISDITDTDCIKLSKQSSGRRYCDRKHILLKFKVGDKVLLSTKHLQLDGSHMLQPRFVGLFVVQVKVGRLVYW